MQNKLRVIEINGLADLMSLRNEMEALDEEGSAEGVQFYDASALPVDNRCTEPTETDWPIWSWAVPMENGFPRYLLVNARNGRGYDVADVLTDGYYESLKKYVGLGQ